MGNFADDKDWTKGANVTMPSWTEIPTDIMEAASECAGKFFSDGSVCRGELAKEFRRALLAERERATKAERDALVHQFIALKYTDNKWMDAEMECFNDGIEACITATAIRTPSTGEGGGGIGPF